jgi:hypothetical protein
VGRRWSRSSGSERRIRGNPRLFAIALTPVDVYMRAPMLTSIGVGD